MKHWFVVIQYFTLLLLLLLCPQKSLCIQLSVWSVCIVFVECTHGSLKEHTKNLLIV